MADPEKRHKRTTPSFDATVRNAGHLLRRAGFGATPDEVLAAARAGLDATVSRLVDYESVADNFVPPPDAILGDRIYSTVDLASWWLERMLTTARPLQEKMTLFWHGHFATGLQKVHNTAYMYRQNQLFRQNALGRFDDLLSAVYKDPAMLVWLDGRLNTKLAPNENWGREVMELFTLGHGNYTEDDVHASSRAFTGWRIVDDNPVFVPRLHDDGMKTLLGQTGNWDGEDAVRILASHPATGPFLATRLWRFFASDTPPRSAIDKLAAVYARSDHDIREMVRTLFTLPEFYGKEARHGHIKSPVEFVVTTLRQLQLGQVDTRLLAAVTTQLGQELFNPPNVGGWPGGMTWINAGTMLGRFNFASRLTGDVGLQASVDPDAILAATGAQTMGDLVFSIAQLLGIELTPATERALVRYAGRGLVDSPQLEDKIAGLIHLALVSPEYQAS